MFKRVWIARKTMNDGHVYPWHLLFCHHLNERLEGCGVIQNGRAQVDPMLGPFDLSVDEIQAGFAEVMSATL